VHTFSRGLLALVAAAGIAALPAAAHADRAVHRDAAGDVIEQQYSEETGASNVPAPTAEAGDITKVVVSHTDTRVVFVAAFNDLRRNDPTNAFFTRIVTNEGVKRDLMLFASPERPRGDIMFTRADGRPATCKGASRDIDYTANTVRLSAPRSCLSSPRWVKGGFGTYRYNTASENPFIDDGQRNGEIDGDLALTGRIAKG
jgi:hypothetical protein